MFRGKLFASITLAALFVFTSLAPASAGALGGARSGDYRLCGRRTHTFHIAFHADRVAEVFVSGDGDTDLDLYVYDERGNRVASDDDGTDQCLARWVPRAGGVFRVEVVNRGSVYNDYSIVTN
jgi:hypothetical protein